MVKRSTANAEAAVVLERQYGPYKVKVCFAGEGKSNAAQNLLDSIMQSYRNRLEQMNSY